MYCPFSSRSRLPSSSVLVSSSIQSGMPSVCSMILIEDLDRQRFAAGDAPDQCLGFPLPETAQCHGGHLRLAGPGRLELRAECHDHEHRQPADALGDPIQQIERGRIDSSARPRTGTAQAGAAPGPPTVGQAPRRSARASVAGRPVAADSDRRPAPPAGRRIRPLFPGSLSPDWDSSAASLSSFAAGASSRAKPAARSSWAIIGKSALSRRCGEQK